MKPGSAQSPAILATMKLKVLTVFLALLLPMAACGPRAQNTTPAESTTTSRAGSATSASTAGFDFYLLNLSWSPEFCYSHPTAAECAAHAAFVLHGLWPQNNDGTYPENCSNAPGPADPTQFEDIYSDPDLLAHEWQTHGTCSGLSADAFFSAARTAYRSVAIPGALSSLRSQTSLPPDQILDLFTASNPAIPRSSLALSCGHNYLTAIELCLDKNLHPIACRAVRSCRANSVRIPPPGH
jgi:ribonuclease T2